MALSFSSCSAVFIQKIQLKQNAILKYGALVVCILLLNIPACLEGLKFNLTPTPTTGSSKEWKNVTTTTVQQQRPHNASGTMIPIVGYKHQNVTEDCYLFQAALAQFVQILHDDPQNHAVRSWTYHENSTEYKSNRNSRNTVDHTPYHFPGLSSQLLQEAFGDRRMALIGDSTLFYMIRWLQTLLTIKSPIVQDSLQSMTMAQANLLVNPLMIRDQLSWSDGAPPFVHQEFVVKQETTPQQQKQQQHLTVEHSYDIVWDGYRGIDEPGGEKYGILWERVRRWQPTILVVNAGLHWLHFQGAGRDAPLAHVRLWVAYENWMEEAVRLASDCGMSLLLFKTTNRICEEKYAGIYAGAVARIAQERQGNTTTTPTFVDRCVQQLEDLQRQELKNTTAGSPVVLSKADIARYCQEGTFDEVGVQHLNDRLFEFIRDMPPASATSNLTISIFNDHDVMTCNYTKETDGRHYHPLNLMRIRLLANMVQTLY